jgi:hypothetical protein
MSRPAEFNANQLAFRFISTKLNTMRKWPKNAQVVFLAIFSCRKTTFIVRITSRGQSWALFVP